MKAEELIGKQIEGVEIGDSVDIRFTDGSFLELTGYTTVELNGDERPVVETWLDGQAVEAGRAGMRPG